MLALIKHRPRAAITSVLALVIMVGGLVCYPAPARPADALNGALQSPRSNGGGSVAKTTVPATDRINILLMGIDARVAGEQDRSDTLVLMSLDKKKGQLSAFSIPRDSRVQIPKHGLDKINHAHAFGGVPLTVQTIKDNFGLPVDYWIRIDIPSMVQLLDVIGPITVNVPYALALDERTKLAAGPQQMDKQLALAYLRERYNDPRGDLGRDSRAQLFLLDLARALRQHFTLAQLPKLYSTLRACVTTDIGLREALSLASTFEKIDLSTIRRGSVSVSDLRINGIFYYEVNYEKTNKVLLDLGLLKASQATQTTPAPVPSPPPVQPQPLPSGGARRNPRD